ncbi:MAG: methyltransferase [Gammaproteobacteria bacterium]|nr:methyltransferase [Gammaproteobacteria bacterium]MDH3379064.1 methyltransferase [Gammaproteobacteria bacterium]
MTEAGGAADIQAALSFIVSQDSKPYLESAALTGDVPGVFFETAQHVVTIHDMRPGAPTCSLDREGFELWEHRTAVRDFYDDAELDAVYDAELELLLRGATGAQRVITFDRTRRSDGPAGARNPDGMRGPADRVHADYTVASGPQRAKDALGEREFDQVLASGGRIVQVNVWRPITGPVRRTPLAVADASSIRSDELVATDHVFPDRVGEIYHLAYAPDQRFYWVPEMQRDEALLIKGWDSVADGRAQFTPHGAFALPTQDSTGIPRESIEVRTYVIFERG